MSEPDTAAPGPAFSRPDFLQVALDYLKRGWGPIPLNGKRPLIKQWTRFSHILPTEEEIRRVWGQWPDANVGLVTGAASGLLVLDIDSDKGGRDSLNGFALPETVTVLTGSGGFHYYFQYPDGTDLANRAGLLQGVDIRGRGGQVVAPPSIHPSGRPYEWKNGPDVAIALPPKWLLERLIKHQSYTEPANLSMKAELSATTCLFLESGAPEGERNDRLFAAAADMAGCDRSYDAARGPLLQAAIQSGLAKCEALETIKSAFSKPRTPARGHLPQPARGAGEVQQADDALSERCRFYANQWLCQVPEDIDKPDLPMALVPVFEALVDVDVPVAELFIGNTVKDRFRLTREDLRPVKQAYENKKEEVIGRRVDSAAAREEALDLRVNETRQQEEREKAQDVVEDPALLQRVLQTLELGGLEGEKGNSLLVYLAMVSRLLDRPISVVVKGESSAGKSYLVTKVLELFDKSAYTDLTDLTAQALYYDEEDLSHKMIVILEKHGLEKANYAIRTLQSEHRLRIKTVEKDENGSIRTRTVEKEGPTGFITTTTDSMIHPENETRNFSLYIDESVEQTRRIKSASARRAVGNVASHDAEIAIWRRLQELLEPVKVRIPYAVFLAEKSPDHPLRIRRDFDRLLVLIETCAFLHQHQRGRGEDDHGAVVVASLADYAMALRIGGDVLARSLNETNEKTEQIVAAAKEVYRDRNPYPDREGLITYAHIAKHLGVTDRSVRNWAKPAINSGGIELVEKGCGSRPDLLRPGTARPSLEGMLPSVEALCEAFPNLATGLEWIDPVTGERHRHPE